MLIMNYCVYACTIALQGVISTRVNNYLHMYKLHYRDLRLLVRYTNVHKSQATYSGASSSHTFLHREKARTTAYTRVVPFTGMSATQLDCSSVLCHVHRHSSAYAYAIVQEEEAITLAGLHWADVFGSVPTTRKVSATLDAGSIRKNELLLNNVICL